jgi:four helix bundle protein
MKQRFEDLIVWQKSFGLSINIYKSFKDCRDFGFKDQITRSSLSIPSNISEGYERGTNKEFIHFLKISH